MDEGAGSGQDDARAAMLAHLIVALSLVIPPAVVAAPVGPVVRMSMVAPATDVQVYASVKVDAAGFGEVGSAIATRVQQQAEATLVAEGVIKRAKVDDLNVFIKVTPPDNGDEGYVLGVAIERLGKPILEVTQDKCELCVEDELIELVAKKMQELAPKMREHMTALAAVQPELEPEPWRRPTGPESMRMTSLRILSESASKSSRMRAATPSFSRTSPSRMCSVPM